MIKGSHHTEESKRKIRDGNRGKIVSEETRRKMREAHMGHPVSEATMRKLRDANIGKKLSEATKRRIGDAVRGEKNPMYGKKNPELAQRNRERTGDKNPMYGKRGAESAFYGKIHTEAAKKRIGDGNRGENNGMFGKTHTEAAKKMMRDANSGKKSSMYGRTADKCPAWRGGISKLPYAFSFTPELKELVKKRDGYMCQFPDCGTDKDLAVHHIDYQKMNNDPKNLITLCKCHNSKVNFDREHWTNYFQGGNKE